MIFGWPVTSLWMLILGLTLLALIVFQVLIGERKIKLGRRTFVYHRYVAYTILTVAFVHALLGVLFVMGWSIL